MAFDRSRLFRGQKLTADRINEVHAGVTTSISNGVDPEAQPGVGKFAIDWNLPSLEAYMFYGLVGDELNTSKILIPFCVPPPQDLADPLGIVDENTPVATLRRLSLGFDQMMTGQGFTDMWTQFGACNNFTFAEGGYGFSLELWEKIPSRIASEGLTGTAEDNVPDNLVWSQDFGASLFAGDVAFSNPLNISDIRVTIQPYRTYIWYLKFDQLANLETTTVGVTRDFGVSSFHIKAEFEYPLMARDVDADFTQNLPAIHDGLRQPASISLDTASPNVNITAVVGGGANGRVQANLETIDARLADQLKAGYMREGDLPVEEELIDDQSMCVIAVPMFGQIGDVRASDINTIGLPWGPVGNYAAGVWPGELADRRFIRLQHPMTIHRILVVTNYYSPPSTVTSKPGRGPLIPIGKPPQSPTLFNKVGVGIASGIDGADDRQYQQVGYLEWTPATGINYVIDRIKEGGVPPYFGLATDGAFDHEILVCPLVYNVFSGVGMYGIDSAPPIYAGRAGNDTEVRTNIGVMPWAFGGGAKVPPITKGREQFLEVRWTMTDAASLSQANINVDPETTYIGNGGCWVYIYGKKSPVSLEG